MDGYSNTPLVKKLGIKEDSRILFINEPASFIHRLGDLPFDVAQGKPKGIKDEQKLNGEYDYIHYFAFSKRELENFFKLILDHLKKDGALWISWPKKDSKIESDLSENVIREIGLANGVVDIKVAAVDQTWSGLKFVYRLKDR